MKSVRPWWPLLCDDEAATAVEYAVMLGLIICVLIVAISAVGTNTGGLWAKILNKLLGVNFN